MRCGPQRVNPFSAIIFEKPEESKNGAAAQQLPSAN